MSKKSKSGWLWFWMTLMFCLGLLVTNEGLNLLLSETECSETCPCYERHEEALGEALGRGLLQEYGKREKK